jgi:hypothetical protein
MRLHKSKVVFDEVLHTYTLGKKQLMGITGLIHDITNLGVYPDASEVALNYHIPHAGARGTAVHSAIELYDTTDIFSDTYTVNWKERNGLPHTEEFDTAAALQGYIDEKTKAGAKSVANEYTVTDGKWASNIDQIWTVDGKSVILVDTKTNNLDSYPGGKQALRQYLSWQLSIYAYLFERQNPKIKVAGLACYWTDLKKGELWDIKRLDDEHVEALLSAEYNIDENGVTYSIGDEALAVVLGAFEVKDDISSLLDKIAELQIAYKLAEAKLNEAKLELTQVMMKNDLLSCEGEAIRVTLTPATKSMSFDSARFKAEHQDLYDEYQKETERKESLRITFKK